MMSPPTMGQSNFDIRNAFKTAAIYDLPVGKGPSVPEQQLAGR